VQHPTRPFDSDRDYVYVRTRQLNKSMKREYDRWPQTTKCVYGVRRRRIIHPFPLKRVLTNPSKNFSILRAELGTKHFKLVVTLKDGIFKSISR
jgi:hypothetical protein